MLDIAETAAALVAAPPALLPNMSGRDAKYLCSTVSMGQIDGGGRGEGGA